jgi:hypothetical protein
MSIESEQGRFIALTREALPKRLAELQAKMKSPHPLSIFAEKGSAAKGISSKLRMENDIRGCYVILQNEQPIYVGISRTVIRRLRQHVTGRTHYSASLAYRMACDRYHHDESRDDAMENPEFAAMFQQVQEELRKCQCAFVGITDPVERYLFEVFCALEFKTERWNTFETH